MRISVVDDIARLTNASMKPVNDAYVLVAPTVTESALIVTDIVVPEPDKSAQEHVSSITAMPVP